MRQKLRDRILDILGAGEKYGAEILHSLTESGQFTSIGAMYVALDRLESDGLVVSRYSDEHDDLSQRGGRRKKYFKRVYPLKLDGSNAGQESAVRGALQKIEFPVRRDATSIPVMFTAWMELDEYERLMEQCGHNFIRVNTPDSSFEKKSEPNPSAREIAESTILAAGFREAMKLLDVYSKSDFTTWRELPTEILSAQKLLSEKK